MKSYYRIMPGSKSRFASECFDGGYIGADYGIAQDLRDHLPDEWRAFNREFIPVVMANIPGKTKVGAGLACGMLHTVCKGMLNGDIVLSPDGSGVYRVGEVVGDYHYAEGENLPHRRSVRWFDRPIPRADMSEALQNSSGSIGTLCNLTKYAEEIELLIGDRPAVTAITSDPTIEDPSAFAMEKHLEEFLVANWNQTELAQEFDIFQEDGEIIGQQYQTDSGPLDILAVSRDRKRLLVVELKRGRASDVVVGQILRYMGYVQSEIAEPEQAVEGVIIALRDDPKLHRALQMVPSISFYRYEVSFKLRKGMT
tara:strand:- start:18720 stop:19652 length:933 start_codon:yes stop_codon:yes gene_type:complete